MKKILVITPRFPIPPVGACEHDRLEGIKQLKRLGNDVQVIGKVFDFQDRDKNKIDEFTKEYGISAHLVSYSYRRSRGMKECFFYYLKRLLWPPYWDGAVYEYADSEIKNKMGEVLKSWRPDIVWFDYTFMLPLYPLARKYGCKIITHSLIYDPKNLLEEEGRTLINRMRAALKTITDYICVKKSDYMFAISPDEKKMYEKLGAKKIEVLSLRKLYDYIGKNNKTNDRTSLKAFFIGSSYNIKHNLQAAKLIIEQIAPKANQMYPGKFSFFITGGKLPEDLRNKCVGNINYVGYVEDFEAFLSDMDIALIPSVFGTGMQQKIFEPITRGFPVITSKRGLGDYPFECGKEILCAYEADEFVRQLGKMLDINIRKELSRRVLEKSRQLFSRERSDKLVIDAIKYVNKIE